MLQIYLDLIFQALLYHKYSVLSDIWSYGCVLYEIWSLGHKPFEDYPASDVCICY